MKMNTHSGSKTPPAALQASEAVRTVRRPCHMFDRGRGREIEVGVLPGERDYQEGRAPRTEPASIGTEVER